MIHLSAILLTAMTMRSFHARPTLSRSEARKVYDGFAIQGHSTGGKDADSGYGGPAVSALLEIANFDAAKSVLDFGCGQGKLCELVLKNYPDLFWRGVDQSPEMVKGFQTRCVDKFGENRCSVELLENGDPASVPVVNPHSVDRFVSTYCLDLLSEKDMFEVLSLAEKCLQPDSGRLLLAGITWGYRASWRTFLMTVVWETLYRFQRSRVGGCRPQELRPYLEAAGWEITDFKRTMPNGFPWMISEVIAAKPPTFKTLEFEIRFTVAIYLDTIYVGDSSLLDGCLHITAQNRHSADDDLGQYCPIQKHLNLLSFSFFTSISEEVRKDSMVDPSLDSYCFNCGTSGETTEKCSGCRVASYCSRQGQKQNWKYHKHKCCKKEL